MKNIFLIDFDNTLFDTEKFKAEINQKIDKDFKGVITKERFWQIYHEIYQEYGYNNIDALSQKLIKLYPTFSRADFTRLFYQTNLQRFLFPDSLKFIQSLQNNGKVIIYTQGEPKFQLFKIQKTGLGSLVSPENIMIRQKKNPTQLAAKARLIIDDRAEILESTKNTNPKIITIWFKYGKYKHTLPQNKALIDYETESLKEAATFLKFKYFVMPGITSKQIHQLLSFTKLDPKIKKFTHDLERFKNLNAFKKWKKKGKFIYTLTNVFGDLAGIIWFSREKFQNCKYTFAIRVYPPARGKGFALNFMQEAFALFGKAKEGVWLKVHQKNKVALSLYQKFGFEKVGGSYWTLISAPNALKRS